MNFDQYTTYDNEHFLHPWEGMADLGTQERTFSHQAKGIYVTDAQGRTLIDGPGGMWCVQIGYGRVDMAKAITNQVLQSAYYSPWNMTSAPAAKLARKLAQLTPGDLNHVFFTTGGSTAVDTALRFTQFYNNALGRPDKKHIISRAQAYHGSTYLAASVSGKERDRTFMDTVTEWVHFLPHVNPLHRPGGQSVEAFCDAKVADLEQAILSIGADRVAAFIAEPILASGGVIIPPQGYQRRCWELCQQNDVLYIADEVVTGFGRLGHWFASEEVFDMTPDLMTSAKGLTSGYLPLGGCFISERLINQLKGMDATFANGYTYSGHPVSCAAALKNIEIIEQENLLEHVREVSPYFLQRLQKLQDLPIVIDVRALGLVGCVECSIDPLGQASLEDDAKLGYRIDAHCQALGLIVRPIINMCVLSPALIISRSQIDDMLAILEQGIRLTIADLQAEGLLRDY